MGKKSKSSSGGIGFLSLLTILFIGLKLTNYIDWNWWWVLSPTWIPAAIFIAVGIIALIGGIITIIIAMRDDDKDTTTSHAPTRETRLEKWVREQTEKQSKR